MAVRIDGNNDLINAADGTLTIEGISVNVVGVSTASGGYKVGTAYTVFPNGNVATAGVVTSTKLQVNSATNTAAQFRGSGGAGFISISDGDDGTQAFIGVDAGILKFQTSGSSYSDKLTITTGGDINVASAATIKASGNATFSGIVTAASFIGDGSGLSGVTATTINNNANNRVITGSGSANTLEAESNMTFTGSILTLTNSSGASELTLVTPSANDSGVYFNDGTNSGAVTYNHSDDSMRFRVGTQERLRITGVGGSVGINEDTPLYELVVSPVDSNESQLQILAGGNGKESNVLFGAPDDADVGSIKYDHNGDHMKFTVGTSEIFRANSNGICLGGTGSANGLDDYEFGTFTPTCAVETQSNMSLSVATGLYVKVGKTVHVWFEIQVNGTPSNRTTGNAWEFGGFPFVSQNDTDSSHPGLRDYRYPLIAMSVDTSSQYGSNGHFILRLFDNSQGGRIEWQHSDLSLKNASLFIQDTTMVQFGCTYPTSM